MIITRYKLNIIKKKVKNYINNQKRLKTRSKLYKIAVFICRSKNIKIDFERKLLNNIFFITDAINNHWAETDGYNIYINNIKNYNNTNLYYTLLHETLHSMIKRANNDELSEFLEHKFMFLLNKKLI